MCHDEDSNMEVSQEEKNTVVHRHFAKITQWILWLIFEKKTEFDDLLGDGFLEALWLVLHQRYHDQVPAEAVKLIRRYGIHFAHVVDISQKQFEKASKTRPAKPNTKPITKTTTKGPRPSDDKINEAFEKARQFFNGDGTKATHKLAGTVKVKVRPSTSSTSDRPSTSARPSTSSSTKRLHTSDLSTPSKRQKQDQESEPDWLPEVLQMTLGDFEDVKVIGSTIGAIKEYKAYTIDEFLQLPHFARAKAVADPAEALKAYRAANDKRKEDKWFQKLERLYKKANVGKKRYLEVTLPEVSSSEEDIDDRTRGTSPDSEILDALPPHLSVKATTSDRAVSSKMTSSLADLSIKDKETEKYTLDVEAKHRYFKRKNLCLSLKEKYKRKQGCVE